MGFWIFMLFNLLLVPVIMIGFGAYFKNNAPKDINDLFGYRTKMSKKNKDTWIFAHHCCGKLWLKLGLILLPLTVICMIFALGKTKDFIGLYGLILTGIQMVVLISTIFLVERKLKENFNKDGTKK